MDFCSVLSVLWFIYIKGVVPNNFKGLMAHSKLVIYTIVSLIIAPSTSIWWIPTSLQCPMIILIWDWRSKYTILEPLHFWRKLPNLFLSLIDFYSIFSLCIFYFHFPRLSFLIHGNFFISRANLLHCWEIFSYLGHFIAFLVHSIVLLELFCLSKYWGHCFLIVCLMHFSSPTTLFNIWYFTSCRPMHHLGFYNSFNKIQLT